MAGIDENVAIIGDWVPPTPSPRSLFSSMLCEDITRPLSESSGQNRNERTILGQRERVMPGYIDNRDVKHAGDPSRRLTEPGSSPEQKNNARGGSGCLVERLAARTGFNAPKLNTENIRSGDHPLNTGIVSPHLTLSPGFSPTTLLESPVFLSNSLAQPSPTTGKFSFIANGNGRSSTMISSELSGKTKDNFFEEINTSFFAFKPVPESVPSFFPGAVSKQSFPSIEVSVCSENSLQSHIEPTKVQSQNRNGLQVQADLSRASAERDNGVNIVTDQEVFNHVDGSADHSQPFDDLDEEGDHRGNGDLVVAGTGVGAPAEDGYNWRKYGQKQVKGSEYPRSYYKCTHSNCQVKKKVERSHEGHITEIIYKGGHNHPKPLPNRRSTIGTSNAFVEMQLDNQEQKNGADGDPVWVSAQKGTTGIQEWRNDSLEVTSSASKGPDFCNQSTSFPGQNGAQYESGDAVDASSTFSNDNNEDDRGTHNSVSLGYDGEGDESESKRRKFEAYATEMSGATRAIREPRVVVQTTSEVDILDDGYRWRKYGQKVVKGNPNPRSYYKCTNAGCTVRKHVERASHDLKSVITTYEGKHNHDVPAARNSSHVNSGSSSTVPTQAAAGQTHVHRPEPSQIHNSMARFERPVSLDPFGMPGRQQMLSSNGFSFATGQTGLSNLAVTGMGTGQGKMPVPNMHPYLAQQCQVNEMGFMLPKGEPKMEPVSELGLNISSNSALYNQIMSRLPLGPQM